MTQDELQQLVETISKKEFHILFQHKALFNTRLRTTGGRYHLETHHLDFNPKILDVFGIEEFIGVVRHELCHYHLHLAGKGYRHQDKEFVDLLKQVGGSRFVKSLIQEKAEKEYWVYVCTSCQQRIYRQRRFDTKRYVCVRCQGRLELVEKEKIIMAKQ